MKKTCAVVVLIILIFSLSTTECISNKKYIKTIEGSFELNFNETVKLNFTQIGKILTDEGFTVELQTMNDLGGLEEWRDAIEKDYIIFNDLIAYKTSNGTIGANEWNFNLDARLSTNTSSNPLSRLSVSYFPIGEYRSDYKKAEANAKNEIKIFADICGVNLDGKWNVWYAYWSDGTRTGGGPAIGL